MKKEKHIRLNRTLPMNCVGASVAGLWPRSAADPAPSTITPVYWIDIGQTLERGRFDGLFSRRRARVVYDVYGNRPGTRRFATRTAHFETKGMMVISAQ